MKAINYFGQSVTVPDYAEMIATDEDGEMWWYKGKVRVRSNGFSGDVCGRVGNNPNIKNWRRSLREC